MAKGLLGGMTDYNHQSFSDILKDLVEERERAISFRDSIQQNIDVLTLNEYWKKNVPNNFKSIVAYSLRHYNTVIAELEDIPKDLDIEVLEHHVNRLKRISTVAQEINVKIGKLWHNEYDYKDYGNENFDLVENIYGDTRDMAVNLLDIENIAERLKDFIGKKKQIMKRNNPWLSGSFYLVAAIIIISGLGVLSKTVVWYLFPIILIGGILIIGLVGILQLRNDDRISDRSFVSLIKETFKRLPLLNQIKKNGK
ncbi:hypothetical protein [Sunxiuqinia dokdonensis]|uniref:Uncharacterized protein n=1 Tax=Sunxiuqinia dokdonensis TaxID=1409788 RepID=A0A0L8VCT1_9BACT|nr:hypothetical protein [Sunxiuqinia dokdonensis]KOH45997.1 hypothetical protein NC99_11870 [Sunxiuqinia dokdonensis]